MDRPYGLLAELTYRCPLACAYCSNPTNLSDYSDELDLAEWQRVLGEAADLGVLQCHVSGGEPLLRRDAVDIVRTAHEHGMYTNLITSAMGFSPARAEALKEAGLDHVQISIQADEPSASDRIAGIDSFERKLDATRLTRELGWPLTVNVVLHRQNIDRIAEIIELAEQCDADRLELANTQYYGWAWKNRAGLMPTREQLFVAEEVVREATARLAGRMDVIFVLPDYYEQYPKPCMGGWGRRQLTIAPNGDTLPCPASQKLPLPIPNVREQSLADIWESSTLFTSFRGTSWMPEPCFSCDRKEVDFGGCRCQAFELTGDPARTDPVCHLSPDRHVVDAAVAEANEPARPIEVDLVPRPHR